MNVFVILAYAVLTGFLSRADTVKICMEAGSATPFVVTQAELKASRMFADIGVKIEWLHGRRDCQVPREQTILVRMLQDSPATLRRGVLAYALPYEGVHVEVFYDRVVKMMEAQRRSGVLAHVLVHEVAHILQGVDRHSGEGLMKAHWDENDYMQMSSKALPFTQVDVELIQRGLETRTTRLATAADRR